MHLSEAVIHMFHRITIQDLKIAKFMKILRKSSETYFGACQKSMVEVFCENIETAQKDEVFP